MGLIAQSDPIVYYYNEKYFLCNIVVITVSSVQLLNCVRLFVTPWTAACQASLSITNSRSLLKLRSITSVILFNYLIQCRPLLLLPSIFPASGSFPMSWFFASGGQSIGVSALASVLPMNFQDWLPLGWTAWISLQRSLKSLLQHHSSKPSILWYSDFFIVQLSHPYMTTEKIMALTVWAFVSKAMSLLFNTPAHLIFCKSFNFLVSGSA